MSSPNSPDFGPGPQNPYAPPSQHAQPPADPATRCPQCASTSVFRPTMTWWGGLLGPKIFNHMKCTSCGFGYNARTGRSNSTVIGIYLGVSVAIAIASTAYYFTSMR
jgi:rubredoxin